MREEVLALASAVERLLSTLSRQRSSRPHHIRHRSPTLSRCRLRRVEDRRRHRIEVGKPSWITRNTAADEVLDTARAQGESRARQ
ncbi:cation-transporting P-type ATPase B domain protein [Mycobacterium ulcerans str. Harvey]|uniref:Cation-transporting P-type ATPase B domain protein n=1 Tax=Mycobacterium ulcerans str. Harvey TaxID=1299332 RepID=A0ABN0RAR4_MYCUL|nr:cation-transporting P-type ATPase B domain protein [Mycobacterium ulcerans str. Harvey]